MSQTDQMHKDNKGYNNSNYYRELSNGLDVSNSYPEETNNLKSSQSNYSFNNTGLKTRIIKMSTIVNINPTRLILLIRHHMIM